MSIRDIFSSFTNLNTDQFQSFIDTNKEGSFTFTAHGYSNGQEIGQDRKRIEVIPYNREFINTRQDTIFLKVLATENGGQYFTAQNVASIKDYLNFEYTEKYIENEVDLRYRTWFLILILVVAVFEWALRKKNNLV